MICPSKVSASQSSLFDRRVACGLFARTSTASERRKLSPKRRTITPPTRRRCMRRCGGPGEASPPPQRADAEENEAVAVSRVLKLPRQRRRVRSDGINNTEQAKAISF